MSLILECPNCHSCHTVEDWNEHVADSILIDRAVELIPTTNDLDWELYAAEYSGVVDCPSCGEACCYEDMQSV